MKHFFNYNKWELLSCFIFGLLVFISFNLFQSSKEGNYMDVSGIVLKKYDNPKSHYKSTRITSEFIMVVKMSDGNCFDIEVSPTTFTLFEEGDLIAFKHINKHTVYRDYKNAMPSIMAVLSILFCLAFLISCIAFVSNIISMFD